MLESAEILVENLDSLSDILDEITNKYEKVSTIPNFFAISGVSK